MTLNMLLFYVLAIAACIGCVLSECQYNICQQDPRYVDRHIVATRENNTIENDIHPDRNSMCNFNGSVYVLFAKQRF